MTESAPLFLPGQLELEAAIAIRQRFSGCCRDIAERQSSSEAVAAAIAMHLSDVIAQNLPLAAQTVWLDRIVRPIKANAAKSLSLRAISGIRSWPSARVADLIMALEDIERILIDAENDARNEIIYADISRAYS